MMVNRDDVLMTISGNDGLLMVNRDDVLLTVNKNWGIIDGQQELRCR